MIRCMKKKHLLLLVLCGLFLYITQHAYENRGNLSEIDVTVRDLNVTPQPPEPNITTINDTINQEPPAKELQGKICSLAQRAKRVEKFCEKQKMEPAYLLTDKNKIRQILVDDRHKIIICIPPKCGTSTWYDMFMRSHGHKVGAKRMNVHSIGGRMKHGLRPLKLYTEEQIKERLENYFKFVIVRHPFDRIVSAWRDKFVFPSAFYHGKGKAIVSRYKKDRSELKNVTIDDPAWKDIPYFVEFARNLASGKGKIDVHWAKFQSYCAICSIKWDGVVKVETSDKDAPIIIEKLGNDSVTNSLRVNHSHQHPSAINSLRKRLQQFADIRPNVLKYLLEFYKADLDMFSYTWDQSTLTTTCGADGCC